MEAIRDDRARAWRISHHVLSAAFVLTAALNLLQVNGGFLTNHAADLVVPAWLYVGMRDLYRADARPRGAFLAGWSSELAASVIFLASAATELAQFWWPRGVFAGTFDPWDIVAYAVGVAACYAAEKRWPLDRGELLPS